MEIANTENYELLQTNGSYDKESTLTKWEQLISENSKHNNNAGYDEYLTKDKQYKSLINDYTTIKAALIKLSICADEPLRLWLWKLGYKVTFVPYEKYSVSLGAALKRLENLVSKILMVGNEISSINKERSNTQVITFDDLMANLVDRAGYSLPDNITLARFNSINKVLSKKSAKA